jgi:hypothetical protein
MEILKMISGRSGGDIGMMQEKMVRFEVIKSATISVKQVASQQEDILPF